MRKEEIFERPVSVKSFNSMVTVALSRLAQNYDDDRFIEKIIDDILDDIEINGEEILDEEIEAIIERPPSAATMQTLESEMTIPSPMESPREELPANVSKPIQGTRKSI